MPATPAPADPDASAAHLDAVRDKITATTMRLFHATTHAARYSVLTVLSGLHLEAGEHDPAGADSHARQALMFDILADAERGAVQQGLRYYVQGDLPGPGEQALLNLLITREPGERRRLYQQIRDSLHVVDTHDPALHAIDVLLVCLRTSTPPRTSGQAFGPPTVQPAARPAAATPASVAPAARRGR
ncbi:hypothetical protein [Actinoplanes regularis]|uniref:hypothetical protein n=1 Tax=Actinoplanes regularis TaxID=52697 RepID=UPI0024A0AF8A|nr:hypothetical protein [Actinoplanes regularis]GLW34465.1 hypothetical protein Areg01_74020 [Actinoplanes regularis]